MDLSFEIPSELIVSFNDIQKNFEKHGDHIDHVELVLYESSIEDPLTRMKLVFSIENGIFFLKSMNRI